MNPGQAVQSWRGITYVVVGAWGRGGSSRVYRTIATSGPHRGVTFAVKLFNRAKADWQVNFMREIHVLRDCDHPAITRVIDEGVYHLDKYQHPFVVMEFFPRTLAEKVKSPDGMPVQEKIAIVLHLLSALNYLARREPPIVHRDIKPTNIFLREDGCLLGDFGLILQLHETRLSDLPQRGSVPEMAQKYRTPELVAYHNGGQLPGPASDVFQLGLVAAELFTGRNPLKHEGPTKPIALLPVEKIPGRLGGSIRGLLEQMLTEDANARPDASRMLKSFQDVYLNALE